MTDNRWRVRQLQPPSTVSLSLPTNGSPETWPHARAHTHFLFLSLSSCLCLSINTPKQLLHHQKKRTMGIYLYIFILYIFIYFFIFPKIPAQNKQIIKHTHIHTHTLILTPSFCATFAGLSHEWTGGLWQQQWGVVHKGGAWADSCTQTHQT